MKSDTADTADEIEFLRIRIGSFVAMAALLFGVAALFRVALAVMGSTFNQLLGASFAWHVACIGCLVVISACCRPSGLVARRLRRTETLGLLAASITGMMVGFSLPLAVRPERVAVLALTFMLFARAIYVPSTAHRSALLSAIIGVPLVVGSYAIYYRAGPEFETLAIVASERWSRPSAALEVAIVTAMWWTMTTLVTTAASRVIFGLRRRVQKAERLGQYTLEEKIGEGGMGVVWRARHAMLRRPTAIKLLHPDRIGDLSLERFESEVQLTAQLSHPNTVTVFDYGRTPDGVFYYAMELLDGASLEDVVTHSGPLTAPRAVHILESICSALSEAHDAGLIHRDIKPANIILCHQGGDYDVAKVLDFGLAVQTTGDKTESNPHGTISGTPQYMSPEAIVSPDSIDHRIDIYSLGCVAYYMLSGHEVFRGESVIDVCSAHLHQEPPPITSPNDSAIPSELQALVQCCLEKEPSARPQTMAQLSERLQACPTTADWGPQERREWWKAWHSRNGDEAGSTTMDECPPREPKRTVVVELDAGSRRSGQTDSTSNT